MAKKGAKVSYAARHGTKRLIREEAEHAPGASSVRNPLAEAEPVTDAQALQRTPSGVLNTYTQQERRTK
jgi:hypothetical protein